MEKTTKPYYHYGITIRVINQPFAGLKLGEIYQDLLVFLMNFFINDYRIYPSFLSIKYKLSYDRIYIFDLIKTATKRGGLGAYFIG